MPTAQNYDAVPYRDCPLIQTRPDYLGLIGRLMGLNTASPDNCRVLELGCASGGNIIPLAYYWPSSEFIGIELSQKQAALGLQIVDELELTNIKIIQQDIAQLDESVGTFDYVIAHGIYSWVPPQVQDSMLKLIPKVLAPKGIAFISYNTYPGWHFRMAVRDIMLHPGNASTSPEQKSENAIIMLRKLANGLSENSSLSEMWLKKEAETLLTLPPSYLLHDYLEENNNPEYFSRFMQKAEAHHLQFLCEADLYTMLGSTLTKQAESELEEIDDLIEHQQYLDYYYVRFFRQTLLCHDNIEINYDLDIENLKKYFFIALLTCIEEIDLNSEIAQTFTHPDGESFDISHPLTKAALVALSHHYPNAYSYPELTVHARQILQENHSEYATTDTDNMLSELFNLFVSQGLELTQVKREFSVEISDKPKASTLAQVYAKHNRCCIGNMHHNNFPLDGLDNYILRSLDGSRTKEQIKEQMEIDLSAGTKLQQILQQQEEFSDRLLNDLENTIDQSLYLFTLNGLLNNE